MNDATEHERQETIATLCRIDPNGDWRDCDSDEPLTLEDAKAALAAIRSRD